MKNINVRVNDQLFADFRVSCFHRNVSMKHAITEMVVAWIRSDQALSSVAALGVEGSDPAAGSERPVKRNLGRLATPRSVGSAGARATQNTPLDDEEPESDESDGMVF